MNWHLAPAGTGHDELQALPFPTVVRLLGQHGVLHLIRSAVGQPVSRPGFPSRKIPSATLPAWRNFGPARQCATL